MIIRILVLLLLPALLGCDAVIPIESDDTYENYRFVKVWHSGSWRGEIHTTECSDRRVVNLMDAEWPRGGQLHTLNGATLITRQQARALLKESHWERCHYGLCRPNP